PCTLPGWDDVPSGGCLPDGLRLVALAAQRLAGLRPHLRAPLVRGARGALPETHLPQGLTVESSAAAVSRPMTVRAPYHAAPPSPRPGAPAARRALLCRAALLLTLLGGLAAPPSVVDAQPAAAKKAPVKKAPVKKAPAKKAPAK